MTLIPFLSLLIRAPLSNLYKVGIAITRIEKSGSLGKEKLKGYCCPGPSSIQSGKRISSRTSKLSTVPECCLRLAIRRDRAISLVMITMFFNNKDKSMNYSKANHTLLYNPTNQNPERTFCVCSSQATGPAVMGQSGRSWKSDIRASWKKNILLQFHKEVGNIA